MLFLLCVPTALADERDDDIFGSSAPDSPPAEGESASGDSSGTPEPAPASPDPTASPVPGEPVRFGEVEFRTTTNSEIAARLATADERLTVGGKLYLRASSSFAENTDLGDQAYASPNLLDLYADVRPNDRVRGFASGRFTYDFTVSDGDTDVYGNAREAGAVTLDQLWLKFDIARVAYITTGRQRVKWGSGRFWNPTDFLNQQTLDALNASVFDERTGVALVKAHVPLEAIGANLYAVGNFEGADALDKIGGALRTEWVIGPSELALSAAARKGDPLRLGADISAGLGPFDIHVEAATKYGDKTPYFTGEYDLATFTIPEWTTRSDEWIAQVTAGAEIAIKYSDRDSFYLGAEYFYNGAGYEDASLYPWLLAASDYYDAVQQPTKANSTAGLFTPFYLGQHYAGAYVYFPSPGRWDEGSITASTLANLSDESYISRVDVSSMVLSFLTVNVYAQVHYGEAGEFHFSYEIEPIPGLLDDGFTLNAPVADVGVGAVINF